MTRVMNVRIIEEDGRYTLENALQLYKTTPHGGGEWRTPTRGTMAKLQKQLRTKPSDS